MRALHLPADPDPETTVLPAAFFARPTLQVAQEVLGAVLVHHHPSGTRMGRVVETEAYVGPEDRGSHAFRGLTERTRPMFGPPGMAYVYLIYGMYHCLNVVTEREGFPAAILIRALEPLQGLEGSASGPGRLCRAMGIERSFSGRSMLEWPLYFLPGEAEVTASEIASGPRVGIEYAGEWARKPWRFWLAGYPASGRSGRPAGKGRQR